MTIVSLLGYYRNYGKCGQEKQLEAARATPALSRFHYDAMPGLKSPNLSIAVFAADTLLYDLTLTSDLVTLTFDLEHLQRIRIIAF